MLTPERHYTLRQLEKIWQINYHTLRRWFQKEPGVVNAGNGTRNRNWRIPESVAQRVYCNRVSHSQDYRAPAIFQTGGTGLKRLVELG